MFNLYENIRSLCEEKGITVSAMCNMARISKSTMSNLKNGRTDFLNITTATKIAHVLGVTTDDVLHGKYIEEDAPTYSGERDSRYPSIISNPRTAVMIEAFEKLSPEDQNDVLCQVLLKARNQTDQDAQK